MLSNELSLEQPTQVIAPSQLDARVQLEKRVSVLEVKILEVPSKDAYYKLKEEFAKDLDKIFERSRSDNAAQFTDIRTEIKTINRLLWATLCTLWFTTIAMCLSIFLELPWGKIISVILLENAVP